MMTNYILQASRLQTGLTCLLAHPVEAGFVTKAEEWKYSSAIDYYDGKGLLEIIKLDALIV
jgi:hypothetical protein